MYILREVCKYFKDQSSNSETIDKIKENYCSNNNLHCAIYMVSQALGNDKVPDDLLPEEKPKAYEIISGA